MSFVVKHLPPINDLIRQFESNPSIIEHYIKFEGFNGSTESVKYLQKKIKTFLEKQQEFWKLIRIFDLLMIDNPINE